MEEGLGRWAVLPWRSDSFRIVNCWITVNGGVRSVVKRVIVCSCIFVAVIEFVSCVRHTERNRAWEFEIGWIRRRGIGGGWLVACGWRTG